MKNNQLIAILVSMMFLSTMLNVWFIYRYNTAIYKIRQLEPKLGEVNQANTLLQGMYNDTVEYSKTTKNPADINHLLQSLSAKPATTAK